MLNQEEEARFRKARRESIARDFPALNEQQLDATLCTEGPLLLLAGAGSGKTTVLISRIGNLIRYGQGSSTDKVPEWVTEDDLTFLEEYAASGEGDRERQIRLCAVDPVPPWAILAITFTNKAADELKSRLEKMLGPSANEIWASTFHSCCVRILRRYIDRLGFPKNFTIYDTEDSQRVLKIILRDLGITERDMSPRKAAAEISKLKDSGMLARDCADALTESRNTQRKRIAQVYDRYEKALWEGNALDFDDLILYTVRLFDSCSDVLEHYQNQFQYVLVDEYQDTNPLQFQLSAALAGGYGNFCVVGDDDQSIYRFRGATIENILSFSSKYPECRTIRLERNYRSTGSILDAANSVISHNVRRTGKKLWTSADAGDSVILHTAADEAEEADYVAAQIVKDVREGMQYRDHAILYRMNAQSNRLEQSLRQRGIPYRVIGSIRFFDRAEIKDVVAYLSLINNRNDNLRLERILNQPPRGIGENSRELVRGIAHREQTSEFDVICRAMQYPQISRTAGPLASFANLINGLALIARELPLDRFFDVMLDRTGYRTMLTNRQQKDQEDRLANLDSFKATILEYMKEAGKDASLGGFLDHIALYTTLDSHDPAADAVVLMTVHSAKGLEFPVVFVTGMEDGIFPYKDSVGLPESLEEERRLCYVAMTRAMKKLYMTNASHRTMFGATAATQPSRFLKEIESGHITRTGIQSGSRSSSRSGASRTSSSGRRRSGTSGRLGFADDDIGNSSTSATNRTVTRRTSAASKPKTSAPAPAPAPAKTPAAEKPAPQPASPASEEKTVPEAKPAQPAEQPAEKTPAKPAAPRNTGTGSGTGTSAPRQKQASPPPPPPSTAASSSSFRPGMGRPSGVQLELKEGDRIRHKSFGTGTVLEATPTGNDVMLKIAFDKEKDSDRPYRPMLLNSAGRFMQKID